MTTADDEKLAIANALKRHPQYSMLLILTDSATALAATSIVVWLAQAPRKCGRELGGKKSRLPKVSRSDVVSEVTAPWPYTPGVGPTGAP